MDALHDQLTPAMGMGGMDSGFRRHMDFEDAGLEDIRARSHGMQVCVRAYVYTLVLLFFS